MRARNALHPRSASLAAAAVLAIVGALVFGGAMSAQAVPASVTIGSTGGGSFATGGMITGTITWAGTGGNVRVESTDENGTTTTFCAGDVYLATDTTWQCLVDFEFGNNSVQAIAEDTADPGTTIVSNVVVFTRGNTDPVTVTSPGTGSEGSSVNVGGTGPVGGTVAIWGHPTIAGGPDTALCPADQVSNSGDWSCLVTAPTLSEYTLHARATDAQGGPSTSGTFAYDFNPTKPLLDVFASPTSLDVQATAQADATDVSVNITLYANGGSGGTLVQGCPTGWAFTPRPDTGTSIACAAGAPQPGAYLISSVSFVNDVYSSERDDLIRIPNVPALVSGVPQADGSVTFSGTQSAVWSSPFTTADGGAIVTVETVGGDYICSASGDAGGNFSCNGDAPVGTQQFRAFATSDNFQGSPASVDDYWDGDSAYSGTITVVVPALLEPTITCAFSPNGQVGITAGANVNASLYAVAPGSGDAADEPGLCGSNAGNPLTDTGPFAPPIDDCGPTCTSALDAGVYRVHYLFSDEVGPGHDFSSYDYFFTIPGAPAVTSVSNAGRAYGTGTAGDSIRLVNGAGAQLCAAVIAAAGTWNCPVTLPATAGQARAYQVDAASGGVSAYSGYVTLPTLAVAPATVTPRPWSISWGDVTEFHPGDSVTIEGTDAPANATIDAELHSTPILLGSTTADALGNFSLTTTIPMDAEAGAHHIVVIATPTDGSAPFEMEQAVTVIVDPVDAVDESTTAESAGVAPGSSIPPRQHPGALSGLSNGLISPLEVLGNPLALVTAGSLGLALVLLVLVPAEFFGEALANHYGSMGGFFARRKKLKRFVEGFGEWIEANRFWAGAGLVFVTSIVFCFIDPGFGFDLTSLRLLLSCAASILLVNFLSAGITERIAEKAWKVPTRLEVMPWGLAIAIVGVLVSRILNFSPGFLIGSIIGVSVVGAVSKKFEMRVVLLWSAVVWAVAMLSWVLAPLVPTPPVDDPAGFLLGFLSDSLVATSAAGLTALLVALLPIALFDGGVLFKHSKLRWSIAFGIAVASFAIVVLPSASNWLGLGDGLLTWLLLTLGFIAVAIITYLAAVRKNMLGRSRLLKNSETSA